MTKTLALSLILICVLGLAACNKTESNSPTIQHPAVQEYVIGQGNIKGNVPVEE